jgi:diamine N-acetyltransferase
MHPANPVNPVKEDSVKMQTSILPATEENLPAISELAGGIWRACYPGIITPAQIDYMLARMYAVDTMRAEIQSQGIRYDRLLAGNEFVGFASYGPTEQAAVFKLHKLYLHADFHGRGLGSRLLQHCEQEVRKLDARQLILAVNKRNAKAIAAYRRNGFVIARSVVTDIGGGFVMDDFIMAKKLA